MVPRKLYPHWAIETELVSTNESASVARAVIKDESGRVIATAHKSETAQGFPDHMEKAETGAIGRALALCGYGTQFTDDLEEGGRLADAPIPRAHSGESAALCEACAGPLSLSKAGTGYYCPNFKNQGNGEHTRFPKDQLSAYIATQFAKKHAAKND